MNREFLLNAFFLLLVNLLVKPLYVFGIERSVQEAVGAERYGLYATLFSFTFLLFMANDFGIHYFNSTNIARHPQLAGKWLPNILMLKGLLSLLYLALVFAAALVRGFERETFHLIFFIALNHVLISLVAYLRSSISGLGMYRTDSAISTLDKTLLVAACSWLLWGGAMQGGFKIEWFIHAQNLAWLLTALAAFFVVKKASRQPLRFRLNAPFLLVVLKKSAPYALAVFLMTAYTRLDIVLLEWLLPDGRREAGAYAAAYRLLDAFIMVAFLFSGLLLPMFSSLLGKEERAGGGKRRQSPPAAENVSSLLRLSLQLIWAGTVTLAVSCFFFKTDIMPWLYPKSAEPHWGGVMGWLILALVPFSGVFVYSTLLTAHGSLRKMNGLFAASIALNLGLNLLLIPRFKAAGAGMAALATQTFVLAGMMFLAKREVKLPLAWWQVAKVAAFALLAAAAGWLVQRLPGFGWQPKFCASLAAGVGLAFALRMVQWRLLLDLAKSKTARTV